MVATVTRRRSPAEALLALLPPLPEQMHPPEEAGNVAGATQEEVLAPAVQRPPGSLLGPLEKVHAFWFAGMSCDGCSIATLGATAPPVEDLLTGRLPGVPRVVLHHPAINLEAGVPYMRAAELALQGKLDAPYVIIYEGSITDETIAHPRGGYWVAQGEEPWGPNGELRPVSTPEWVARLAPKAAAVIAIGTCATWGGIPAADHNPTHAMSVADFLGADYRSAFGLPVINIPGCSPIGDNFTETVAAILLFLNGIGPLPEFDELGRPAWLFHHTVHNRCVRGGYYEEGIFADEYGDPECLVEVGCWGPVVQCNITERGAINHVGGCMNTGGPCIGCTMPGFPDKFTPFYKAPPGSSISSTTSRLVGSFIRPLRRLSMRDRNREVRWDREAFVPSGFGRPDGRQPLLDRAIEYFYKKLQYGGPTRSPSKPTPEYERERSLGQR
jgi:hydrogenase small subunit